jgi:AraC-like DNA-binding protein
LAKGKHINKTYKDKKLPFLELTYNKDIKGCPKSHLHDKLSIVALKKGSINIHLKDYDFVLKEKNIAVLNPFEIHCATKVDDESKGLYALYLDKSWIQKLQNNLFDTDEYILFQENILLDINTYNEFLTLCENIFSNDFYIKKEEQIIEFVSQIVLENSNKKLLDINNNLACDIKSYIDENISLDLSLEDIAKEFLITPFHLIKIFKKELNLTPYRYVLNQKINLAKELLSKDISISEAALRAGFNDQSHLYKYFKEVFSISPKEYQDSLVR